MRTRRAAFWRFLILGGALAALSAFALVGLVGYFGFEHVTAAWIVAIVGNVIGFVGNRQWSFLAHHERPFGQALRYLAVAVVGTVSSVGLFALLTDGLSIHYVVASFVVSAVFAVLNFFFHSHWSFRRLDRISG